LTDGEAALGQRSGEMTLALAHPQQCGFGVATDRRLHEIGQRIQQSWLSLDLRFASAARAADAARRCALLDAQFRKPTANCAARNTRHPSDGRNATAARRMRLARREQPTRAFVQVRCKRIKTRFDSLGVDHPATLVRVAARFLAPDSLVSRQALSGCLGTISA
jgi:hypothetical protein